MSYVDKAVTIVGCEGRSRESLPTLQQIVLAWREFPCHLFIPCQLSYPHTISLRWRHPSHRISPSNQISPPTFYLQSLGLMKVHRTETPLIPLPQHYHSLHLHTWRPGYHIKTTLGVGSHVTPLHRTRQFYYPSLALHCRFSCTSRNALRNNAKDQQFIPEIRLCRLVFHDTFASVNAALYIKGIPFL